MRFGLVSQWTGTKWKGWRTIVKRGTVGSDFIREINERLSIMHEKNKFWFLFTALTFVDGIIEVWIHVPSAI